MPKPEPRPLPLLSRWWDLAAVIWTVAERTTREDRERAEQKAAKSTEGVSNG